MEELVQAINNLSKISIKDVIFLLINIISALSNIIIAILVYLKISDLIKKMKCKI